jgi:hypothetical protein
MIGYLAVSLVSLGALAGAGYYGGRMVFQHGAGVSAIEQFARDRYLRQVRDVYRPETVQDGHVAPAGHASH